VAAMTATTMMMMAVVVPLAQGHPVSVETLRQVATGP